MPAKKPLEFHDNNFSNWANVASYGATPNDSKDDTAAIQAAFDSGKTTIYFPTGIYYISRTLHVRGNVRRIVGLESVLRAKGVAFKDASHPAPLLRFEMSNGNAVSLEQISIGGTAPGLVAVEQATSGSLVIQDASLGGMSAAYRSIKRSGSLLLEDIVGAHWQFDYPQNIWAWHLNAEGWENYPHNQCIPKIRNNGANLWILGLKTEAPNSVIETIGGGKTELLGGLLYPTHPVSPNTPAFINNNSKVSLTYAVSAYRNDRNYALQIEETKQGMTKKLIRTTRLVGK